MRSLDASIDKANAWLADIDAGFGTSDRRLAYRVLRAWLHCLQDRLTVEMTAHFAAQLPELLRAACSASPEPLIVSRLRLPGLFFPPVPAVPAWPSAQAARRAGVFRPLNSPARAARTADG